ncbi:MAG: hypothetical protein A2452_10215 [Candidatus Firestonebacteria bacterium RIFOXYC2_FULL_39_67]|nr:MAG: hypothetical protein A2536_06585 [Candidatus Firestonebacteria bacterium RIFOXYD2_FULL_39_29]OGF52239.1 MAG: hypothetical protein A2497_05625 [Candidatus Firestonebacteria bacterium RifOxyC12_full_39_7]OGF54278.1 MAG: hypothetical protein A2452_10215 [Candidatus Firestonebacteria bacterium RIFOXYC2_FULL_39_67]
MTSKERLHCILKGNIPDRVPVSTYELNGWNFDSFENKEPSYKKLMDLVREKTDCLYMSSVSFDNSYIGKNTIVENKTEGISTISNIIIKTPEGDIKRTTRVDSNVYTTWNLEHFLKTDEDLKRYMSIPDTQEKPDCSRLFEIEKKLGDKGMILLSIEDPICVAAELFEFGEFTIRALTQTEDIVKLLDKLYFSQLEHLKDILKQIKNRGYLFRICGPEYATPPYLSPEYFHDFVCKYDKEFIRLIKESGNFARIHSHGKIARVFDHILEMAPDGLDPIEAPHNGDILLKEAKERSKGKLCLFGNIQLRDLENAKPGEMENIVKDCMKDAKEGGRYVIMPTAAPINVPLSPITARNYEIFIETALKHGKY